MSNVKARTSKRIFIYVGVLLLLFLGVCFVKYSTMDVAVKVQSVANIFMVLGIAFAYMQLRQNQEQQSSNHDWNRRQFAITESLRIAQENKKIHDIHDDVLKYAERKMDQTYLVDSEDGKTGIHDLICEKGDDGKFVCNHKNEYILTPEGRKLSGGIKNILNNFEYLSSGIQEEIFDEETVKRMHKMNMVKAYNVFKLYINHFREFSGREGLWTELETVVSRWEKEDLSGTTKRAPTDK